MAKREFHSEDDSRRLRAFVAKIGMPLKTVAAVSGLPNESVLNWWSGRETDPLQPIHVTRICQFLGVDEEIVFDSSVDFPLELIRQRLTTRPGVLPTRYSAGATSPLLGLLHVAEMSALWLGTDRLVDILLRMHVPPQIFARTEILVNAQFTLDLFWQLAQAGMEDYEIAGLGRFISLSHQHNAFGHGFLGVNSVGEVFGRLERHIDQLDRTLHYDFRFESDCLVIEARPPRDFGEKEPDRPRALARFFAQHQKMLEWFPTLGNLAPISAEVLACPLHGDPTRTYRVALKETEGAMPHLRSILGGGGSDEF